MTNTTTTLSDIDDHLQLGLFERAHGELNEFNIGKLQRAHYASYANLAWRSGNVELGLKLLTALIRNKAVRLSEREWAEYAMCLNSIGATSEAKRICSQNAKACEFSDLYMAFSLIYEWNYIEASPYLESFLAKVDKTSYQYSVAQINLLACLIVQEKFSDAQLLVDRLKVDLKKKYKRLQSNLDELTLQLICGQNRYSEGIELLNNIYGKSDSEGPENILFQKWKTILEVGAGVLPKEELLKVRDLAFSAKMWEVARDCETRHAFATGNPTFIKRSFFSSPWKSYRDRIESKFKDTIDFESPFDLWLQPLDRTQNHSPPVNVLVDVEGGAVGSVELKKGSLGHRLLKALASDLFRPHSVGSLFAKLYFDEYFDIETSPNRVYRAISELRDVLVAANVPLEILQIGTGYRLNALEPTALRVAAGGESRRIDMRLEVIRQAYQNSFSAKEAAELLNVSLKTTQRILNTAIQENRIEKSKSGATVRYRWKNYSPSS